MALGGFDRSLPPVLVHEGGYINHPDDPGGATNKGVTQRVYDGWRDRQNLPRRSVRHIADAEVREIYRVQYWNVTRCDELPAGVDYVVFDGNVNSGPSRSVKWLQRALGVNVDGNLGEATLTAVKKHPNHDGLIARICDVRMGFLQGLKHWPTFGKGWTRRVAGVRKTGQAWASGAVAPATTPAPGGEARANERDIDRPSQTRQDVADAAAGGGVLTTTVSEAAQRLEPIKDASESIGWIFAALTLVGVALVVGGVLLRLWNARKEKRAQLVDDGLTEGPTAAPAENAR
ncbi:MAG: glycoside hydrolase family 108 protein [Beijerinckiaceae bacterium]|nr:glycoside hydrolase family 108 protein [Beijerinckiaceae bacterium]